jgi:hypothetical protein
MLKGCGLGNQKEIVEMMKIIALRPILNFALGVNFEPQGEVVPQG